LLSTYAEDQFQLTWSGRKLDGFRNLAPAGSGPVEKYYNAWGNWLVIC
jgi:hypothetical protein